MIIFNRGKSKNSNFGIKFSKNFRQNLTLVFNVKNFKDYKYRPRRKTKSQGQNGRKVNQIPHQNTQQQLHHIHQQQHQQQQIAAAAAAAAAAANFDVLKCTPVKFCNILKILTPVFFLKKNFENFSGV